MASTLEGTSSAETAEVVVDYAKPLDQMTPEERAAALEHGRRDTLDHINAERITGAHLHDLTLKAHEALEGQVQ